MTNEEIRDSVTVIYVHDQEGGAYGYHGKDVDLIQNETRKDMLTKMRDLALWKGGNTAEEKIQHFFKIINDAIEIL